MRWIDKDTSPSVPPARRIAFWKAITEQRPEDARAFVMLAQGLSDLNEWPAVVAALQTAREISPQSFDRFEKLAGALLSLHRYDEVLSTVEDYARKQTPSWPSLLFKARALHALGRADEARRAAQSAVEASPHAFEAAEQLLRWTCLARDGGALLAACDALPDPFRNSAACLGFRAIALDLLGRTDEAGSLMDFRRFVRQYAIPVPAGFADVAAFNGDLAAEIARHAVPYVSGGDPDSLVDATLDVAGATVYPRLAEWVREAIDKRIGEAAIGGGDPLVASPPAAGYLLGRAFIYRRGASNGVHMHSAGVVSGVYHVQVPDRAKAPDVAPGVLLLGLAPPELQGYRPSWPIYRITPEPGILSLFPSYVYHDFEPTLSSQARIAIGLDLRAA